MSTLKEKAEQILQEKESNILPEKLLDDVKIFDVQGEIITTSGHSAYTNSMYVDNSNNLIFDTTISTTNGIYFSSNADISISGKGEDVASTIGLTPEKIKKDEVILGITGTCESGSVVTENIFYDASYNVANMDILIKKYVNGQLTESYDVGATDIKADSVYINNGALICLPFKFNDSSYVYVINNTPFRISLNVYNDIGEQSYDGHYIDAYSNSMYWITDYTRVTNITYTYMEN